MPRLERLTDSRRQHLHRTLLGSREQALDRLVPIVNRQVERTPVNRKQRSRPDACVREQSVLGTQMYGLPGRMERANLQRHRVKWTEPRADVDVGIHKPGVGSEIKRALSPAYRKRRPQRLVAIAKPTAREVLRRGGDNLDGR